MRAFARTVSIRAPSLIQKIVTICVVHATALTVAACIDEPASPPGIVNLRNMASVGPGELLLVPAAASGAQQQHPTRQAI